MVKMSVFCTGIFLFTEEVKTAKNEMGGENFFKEGG